MTKKETLHALLQRQNHTYLTVEFQKMSSFLSDSSSESDPLISLKVVSSSDSELSSSSSSMPAGIGHLLYEDIVQPMLAFLPLNSCHIVPFDGFACNLEQNLLINFGNG